MRELLIRALLEAPDQMLEFPDEIAAALSLPGLTEPAKELINALIADKVVELEMRAGVTGPVTLRLLLGPVLHA